MPEKKTCRSTSLREALHSTVLQRSIGSVVFFFLVTAGTAARGEEVTPLKAGLREEVDLFVTCALTDVPRAGAIPLVSTRADREYAKGIYHYKLWLPRGYLAQPQRHWPCIFIASPFGNARMGHMADRLKAGGYVVVMLVESRNGPWPPVIGNFLAAHDDVVKRVRIKEGAKVATGLSGGARASAVFVQIRPGFCGAILQGASIPHDAGGDYYFNGTARRSSLAIAVTMGRTDPRVAEIREMQHDLRPDQLAVFLFSGAHQWAPSEVFGKALDWIESRSARRN